jgi:acetylornithine deacetylase/succinyl-diaminopimelate desuccinylase-like protein
VLRQLVEDALALCSIPAPTFAEHQRAAAVTARLAEAGLEPRSDAVGNVLARIGGRGPAVVVAAHLDTVFSAGTPLAPRRDGSRLFGPGIGDNCVALAALLALGRRLAGASPAVPVLLAATVGEEGLGDLRGIRAVLDAEPAVCAIAIEGHGVDSVVTAGVSSARYSATYRGPGGHSWRDRGRPSALHAMFAAGLAALEAGRPAQINVGVAHGGLSVNSIAGEARLEIDIRAVEEPVVDDAAQRVAEALRIAPEGIAVEITAVGKRPGGSIPAHHPLVQAVLRARRAQGLRPPDLEAASTDANAAYGRGIPAVTLGITRGGAAHTTGEWIETGPIADGYGALERLVLDLAGGASMTA